MIDPTIQISAYENCILIHISPANQSFTVLEIIFLQEFGKKKKKLCDNKHIYIISYHFDLQVLIIVL